MSSWNPASKARNFVARIRNMSDGVVAIREEVAQLRAATEALHHETERARGEFARLLSEIERVQRLAGRAARRGTLQRDHIRVVFLVHNVDAWDSIGEVIGTMRTASDFDPVVVSIPHHYAGASTPGSEGRVHRFLDERRVPHLRLRDDESAEEMLLALDPDVVFRQSQWDADVDPAFSADQLTWTRLALIPYETMNPTHNVPWDYPPVNSAVDQRLHRAAWLVFCTNDDALDIARHDTLTGGRQFRAVGHPKADAVRGAVPSWPLHNERTRHRRILWSAHHSILKGWNDFGMFPQMRDEMLAWAAEESATDFVFTHHPQLRGTIRQPGSPITDAEFEAWLEAWEALPNTAYTLEPYAPLLAAADLLVTDGPSMITESQVLTVPTIFFERADHVPFNAIGEVIVTGVHRVSDVAGARAAAEALNGRDDPLAPTQRANVERLFGEPGASQRIVDTIRAEVREESLRTR
ncbi:hypothetical protein FBY40_1481 [Microbacterium sp. SLBN-154]|uniref:hypothetical protein n=1 Tax=Microbacterium sp. SLBN-154 TaxID=2768458 RepID=UPI00115459BA|nr:hypothetical protein [Microbacterium sp. SLBN-154]TQK18990.1 hypothetical protein FBY40_1481 [Microbacterium sp. SLBN-154]